MISEENLVTKYMYKSNPNFKGEDNKFENIDLIYIVEYFPRHKLFIISDEVGNKYIATVDDIFKNFTSIKPLYVISVKKGKNQNNEDVYGLVINPYFSEWLDVTKMPYTYGLELNLSNMMDSTVTNEETKLTQYSFMMYNRLDSDKTPKYDNLETVTVVYGYYNSDVTKLLARIFTNPKLPYSNYLNLVEEVRGYVYWYLKEMHGVQVIDRGTFIKLEKVISESGGLYKSSKVNLNDAIKNICNIPLNFQYIDGATSILEKYDLSMDIEKIKKEYGPYNIVILKVIEFRNGKFSNELSTKIGILNYKSNISNEVEFGLDTSEISKLLDFNKG